MQIECNIVKSGERLIPTIADCEEAARRAEESYRAICREMNWPRMRRFERVDARHIIEAYLAIQAERSPEPA